MLPLTSCSTGLGCQQGPNSVSAQVRLRPGLLIGGVIPHSLALGDPHANSPNGLRSHCDNAKCTVSTHALCELESCWRGLEGLGLGPDKHMC